MDDESDNLRINETTSIHALQVSFLFYFFELKIAYWKYVQWVGEEIVDAKCMMELVDLASGK